MSCYALVNALMDPELTPNESRVYAYLLFRANGARVCWPAVPEIAENLNMSPRAVMSATKRLRDLGRIAVSRRYKDANNYQMCDVPGLHDRPNFKNGEPLPHTEAAPEPAPQKTAPIAPDAPPSPAETDPLPCEKPQSDLREPAQESVQQESDKKDQQERSLRSLSTRARPDWEMAFLEFYHSYPRHKKPDAARKAFFARMREGIPPAEILDGLRRHQFGDRPEFQPYPATWLNGGQWRDEPDDTFDPALRAAGLTARDLQRSMLLELPGGIAA